MLVPCFDCAVQPVWLALLFQACPRSTGMSHRWMGARASRAAMAASASVLSASANPGGPDVIVLTTSFNPPEAASQFNQHTSPRHLFFPSLSHPLSIIPSSFFSFSLSSLCYLLFPSEILPHSPILHPSRSVTTHTELSSASFAGLSGLCPQPTTPLLPTATATAAAAATAAATTSAARPSCCCCSSSSPPHHLSLHPLLAPPSHPPQPIDYTLPSRHPN